MKNNFSTSNTGSVNWNIVAPVAAMVGLLVVANMLSNLGERQPRQTSDSSFPGAKIIENVIVDAEVVAGELGQKVVRASNRVGKAWDKVLDSVERPSDSNELPEPQSAPEQ